MEIVKQLKKRYFDFCRRHFSITRDNWERYVSYIPGTTNVMKYFSHPRFGGYLRRMAGFEGQDNYSQSHIVPINQKVSYKSGTKGTAVPVNLVRQAIKESSYRVIFHRCVCRDGFGCTDYPRDFGCIMLGEGCRSMVARGTARYATVDEALAHLDRAGEMGLVAMCAWVEFESVILGIPEKNHQKFLEICLCCPCCCMGMRNYKHWYKNEELRRRFHSIGWRAARGEGECISCGLCAEICCMDAISIGKEGITISGDCIGCGICAARCPQQAISMQATEPMKGDILDYFWGFRPQISG